MAGTVVGVGVVIGVVVGWKVESLNHRSLRYNDRSNKREVSESSIVIVFKILSNVLFIFSRYGTVLPCPVLPCTVLHHQTARNSFDRWMMTCDD